MNIRLYAVRLDRALGEAETAALAHFLPSERKVRSDRTAHTAETLCAYALLRRALHDRYGWEKLPEISRGAHGKPHFAAYPDVCFSLSHSHGAVLLAVHDHSVGVDIERLRPVSERMRTRFHASDEVAFWQDWVQRESCCKRRGISAVALRGREVPAVPDERIFAFSPLHNYVAGVCTASGEKTGKLVRLTVEELI